MCFAKPYLVREGVCALTVGCTCSKSGVYVYPLPSFLIYFFIVTFIFFLSPAVSPPKKNLPNHLLGGGLEILILYVRRHAVIGNLVGAWCGRSATKRGNWVEMAEAGKRRFSPGMVFWERGWRAIGVGVGRW